MVKDFDEKPEGSVPASDSQAPLSDQGTANMQRGLSGDVQAERERLEQEMKADAAALETKFGPRPPYLDDAGDGADWVERGIQDVPVADLPPPDGVNGPEDFDHHITYEDAMRATREYEQMQPLIAQGYTGEDFSAEDEANGIPYENGRRRIYDLYHGSDPIRLNKDGDQYDIVTGRHRIFAAKEAGLETIPASLSEKVEKQ